jgi:hypothetical protein
LKKPGKTDFCDGRVLVDRNEDLVEQRLEEVTLQKKHRVSLNEKLLESLAKQASLVIMFGMHYMVVS